MKKFFYNVLLIFIFISVFFSYTPISLAVTTPDFSLNSTAAYLYDTTSRSNTI